MAKPDSSLEPILELLAPPEVPPGEPVDRLRDLTPTQWKSGIAAWLGWLFDGMDMHLYTFVATPFVAMLLGVAQTDESVGKYSSIIQAGFLVGWALGGAFFGRIGDRLGRSRALMLSILCYACFTGLSFFAQTWWQLLIFRFLTALGIGGEWAVGASLVSETWPTRWRPWIAAVLQSAMNIGVLMASFANFALAGFPHRCIFLVGVLPALLVVWIRSAVPEPEEWASARRTTKDAVPGIVDLFRGDVRRTTVLTILVCSLALTAHWAFMFWCFQHLRTLPDVATWSEQSRGELISGAMVTVTGSALVGNFLAAIVARRLGYRRTISILFALFFFAVTGAYGVPRTYQSLWPWLSLIGASQGAFALFSMYLPPLFPTLLRTTGTGFCYNIGRFVAAGGTVFFGLVSPIGDYRWAMVYAGVLAVPATFIMLLMPEGPSSRTVVTPVE